MAGNISDSITGIYGSSEVRKGYNPISRELDIITVTDRTMSVNGNDHSTWYRMMFTSLDASIPIEVTVNSAISNEAGGSQVALGTCIIFSQEGENPLTFVPADGVSILSPGELKAFGKGSTATLIAVERNKWILGGDITPNEVTVP